jgi:cytochrome b6-f complex iron-sulfur subunit
VELSQGATLTGGETTVAGLSRRAVLTGCGAACLAVLAGCGNGGSAPAPSGTGGADTDGGAGASTPPGFLIRLDEVPVGGGAIVNGDVLVVQPTAGAVKAFDARCPHAGAIVGTPDATGVITCPAHHAAFRGIDGSLIDGLSPRGLREITVRVRDGAVLRA